MRGKIAKRCRRAAERNTVGMPDVAYTVEAKYGSLKMPPSALHDQCTRFLYKRFKAAWKAMRLGAK